ncbi:hypothetical protein QTP86_014893, partial [Hemibagrus guttatus]
MPTLPFQTISVLQWCHSSQLTCHPRTARTWFVLLHLLPIPRRPWSHSAIDFVTGLPLSDGNNTILTIVDRFSKMVHFVPPSHLPSAKETALLFVQHVFRLHGIPSDIVSDIGPQFTAQFWTEFCRLLGISISLSSGYHPQSNGQTKHMNPQLETGLRLLCSQDPNSWSHNVVWVEYSHNSLPSASSGLTGVWEKESSVPSARAAVQWCHLAWRRASPAIE